MKRIFIVCQIDNPQSNYMHFSKVASNLISFLGETISEYCDYEVHFINLSAPKRGLKSKKAKTYIFDKYTITEFSSGPRFLPGRFRFCITKMKSRHFLKKQKRESDRIMFYHSKGYMNLYRFAINLFGSNNSVLLVAEIYSDIDGKFRARHKEISHIMKFSRYILMSSGIEKIIRKDEAKYIYLYGSYRTIQSSSIPNRKDNNIHIVYSGTTDKIKKGLYLAMNSMTFLPKNFFLHIYCSGKDEKLVQQIKATKNTFYEGFLPESELSNAILHYDIGLSTQDTSLPFNLTSFPSKITFYLGRGLNVVSGKSYSVLNSPLINQIISYEGNEPTSIAKAIVEASKVANKSQNIEFVNILKKDLIKDLTSLLS